jgi:hypothetical protein
MMSDSDFEKIKRQYREAIFADGIDPGAEDRAPDEAELPYVDADGKIKLSDIEKYVDLAVERKLSEILRKYNIPVASVDGEPLEIKTPAVAPTLATGESAHGILESRKPHTDSAPFLIDSIFEQVAGAPDFVQPLSAAMPGAAESIPVPKQVEPIPAPEPEPVPAPRVEAPTAESSVDIPFATPFGVLDSVAAPFEAAESVATPEPVATSEPAATSEPVATAEPIVEAEPAAVTKPTTAAKPDVQLKSADEDFMQEINQIFGRRATGGSIAFDTNRPQVKEITDKFKPITKEATASQPGVPAFEEKFGHIPSRTDGKGSDVELEERLSRVFKSATPEETVAEKPETRTPAGESADTMLEDRISKVFEPTISKKNFEADASFEKRINQMFGPVEDKSAEPLPTGTAHKPRLKQAKAEEKKRVAEKRKRRGFGATPPVVIDGDSASATESAGNDKRIALLVAILVAGAITVGTLSNLGILDMGIYSEWIRSTFGNIFGG